ncbi:GGDEF domain-containing protein [Methylobacterium brachythecii]|uniref:GGDEF domain-containing protein n=1 Tax=Methylobacterium brachythecii TaxID=1176177 RepID=A0ABQ6D0X1_9HYPH|nr:GGDEF domain-containing protein [Methylobacterium brachythecii]
MPTYEAVVLGSLGRLTDRTALVVSREGQAETVLWAGAQFQDWLQGDAQGLPVSQLSDEVCQPVREIVAAALDSSEPAFARCDRISEGVVTTTGLVGVPLANGWGRPLVLIGLADDGVRTELVQAMFGATDQGMLALSTVRDPDGAAVDFKIVAANQGAHRLLNRAPGALHWQRLADVLPGHAANDVAAIFSDLVETGRRRVFELTHLRPDGGPLYLKVEAGSIGDLIALTLTDVGDIKARDASFRLLFENNPVPMWVTESGSGRFLAVNDAAIEHYGFAREAFLGMRLSDLAAGDDVSNASGAMRDGPLLHRIVDGTPIEVNLFERAVPFEGREAVIGAAIDVTERRRAEARIAHMAHHDALTGLPNRVLFGEHLAEALARQERSGEAALLFCLDLDKFKIVNDTLGHAAGDALLSAAAGRLVGCVREGDIVSRLGGDEFAILVRCVESPLLLHSLTLRIIDELSRPFRLDGQDCHIGTSIGVALLPQDGRDPEMLLRHADLALYRAKAAGGGTFRCFEPEMEAWAQLRRSRENDLREAFARGQLSLVCQPLLNSLGGGVTAFEALLRWQHPEHGAISPAEFVPLAEETGLINPIGAWVLRTACAEAATWPDHIRVAVNLSPVQFRNRDLVDTVKQALAESGLAANRLEIEITESVLLAEEAANLAALHALRDLGVRIAMDDFGTGYSSLGYLRSFPFDKIKIDRSFVSQVGVNAHCTAIVRAATGLGASLGIVTTAEGVETASQLAALQAEGCDEVQGFLFSRPVPAEEARSLIAGTIARAA